MFCNLILKGFNEVFICNSVISELGLVHGPGYLFTHLDQKLAHFNGCNCDLFCRALLCATEQTLWHGQTFRAKPKVNFTQSAFKQNPHRYILTKGGLSLYKSRWKEGSLMRPPHLMVQEPWKCTTGSQDCLVAPRKRASWRTRFREGTCSGLQNKSASWRGLLLRPNLARSSSFSFFSLLVFIPVGYLLPDIVLFCFYCFSVWHGGVASSLIFPCESRRYGFWKGGSGLEMDRVYKMLNFNNKTKI